MTRQRKSKKDSKQSDVLGSSVHAPIRVVDRFSAEARALRSHFDERFADPRAARGDRFVWDYWHVPGQYTALRTPAYHYFPKALYDAWHTRLVQWGRIHLGCHDVSPPWLSCYVDGGRQELHADRPHGPWAFVFSLTPWKSRSFRGGETLIVRDEILSLWSRPIADQEGLEHQDIFRAIDPEFNRLTVFDPRLPHGVRQVEGTHDPRQGRLVMHGWFVQPRPFVEGGLSAARFAEGLAPFHAWVSERARQTKHAGVQGVQTFRMWMTAGGKVSRVQTLVNRALTIGQGVPDVELEHAIHARLAQLKFRPSSRASTATLPVIFESG